MNNLIDNILTEWSYRVNDGMPDPKNKYHLVQLKESMKFLKVNGDVINMIMNHLYEAKSHKYIKRTGSKGNYQYTYPGDGSSKTSKSSVSNASKKQSEKEQFILKTIDLMTKNLSMGRETGKAGESKFQTQKEAQIMKDFYIKKEKHRVDAEKYNKENNFKEGDEGFKDPFLRQPKIYKVSEDNLDTVMDALEQQGRALAQQAKERGEKTSKYGPRYLINKIGNKGAPNSNAATPERTREVLKHYLETGGISIMTGEPVSFSASQLDHALSLGIGGKDEPENWHWMEARYNQVKGAREDDEVLKMIEEVIKQSPEEFAAGQLGDEIKNIQKFGFTELFTEKFSNGDHAGLTEESLENYTQDELETMAKALNEANDWGESKESVKRYASNKDTDPDSPTFGQALSRMFSDGSMRVIAKKPKAKLYQKVASGEKLNDKEKAQLEKDKASWGVVWDPEKDEGSPAEFKDTVKLEDGTEIDSTTLVNWKNPKTGKDEKVPIGYVKSVAQSGETRESGGKKLDVARMRKNIIEGFRRSKTPGPLMTKSESDVLDAEVQGLKDKLKQKRADLKQIRKKF